MLEPRLEQSREAYLQFITDEHPTLRSVTERIKAVDNLQTVVDDGHAIRIGQAIIGVEVSEACREVIEIMAREDRLGPSLLLGERTAIDKNRPVTILGRSVILNCDLDGCDVVNSFVNNMYVSEGSRIQDSSVVNNSNHFHKISSAVIKDSELYNTSASNGTIERVSGSTGGKTIIGSLRKKFICVDPTTGDLIYT